MPNAISLFTGVGGLDFGFEAAGVETLVAVEMDPVACRTIGLNRPWEVIEREIDNAPSEEISERAPLTYSPTGPGPRGSSQGDLEG
jgi:DNA (cytosine-5)-methyltransferase 1